MDLNVSSLYCSPNPYGYRYNINHPLINDLYRRYIYWKGLERPMTDAERFEFERYVYKHLKQQSK